jgi:hypothetical protein
MSTKKKIKKLLKKLLPGFKKPKKDAFEHVESLHEFIYAGPNYIKEIWEDLTIHVEKKEKCTSLYLCCVDEYLEKNLKKVHKEHRHSIKKDWLKLMSNISTED